MTPELDAGARDPIERLAETLLRTAGDQSVRAIEALAAALINRARDGDAGVDGPIAEQGQSASLGLQGPAASFLGGDDHHLQLCRRIARRALRGSLADPTRGATAFHRIETTPAWSRHLLPVAVFGSFLFYRR